MRHVPEDLLDCLETRYWRKKFLNKKWLHMRKDILYKKVCFQLWLYKKQTHKDMLCVSRYSIYSP